MSAMPFDLSGYAVSTDPSQYTDPSATFTPTGAMTQSTYGSISPILPGNPGYGANPSGGFTYGSGGNNWGGFLSALAGDALKGYQLNVQSNLLNHQVSAGQVPSVGFSNGFLSPSVTAAVGSSSWILLAVAVLVLLLIFRK